MGMSVLSLHSRSKARNEECARYFQAGNKDRMQVTRHLIKHMVQYQGEQER